MRFHSDPLYNCWTPNTAVVSIGAPRRFAFRCTENFQVRQVLRTVHSDVQLGHLAVAAWWMASVSGWDACMLLGGGLQLHIGCITINAVSQT